MKIVFMKTLKSILIVIALVLFVSCNKADNGRFNYPLIKSKLQLTKKQDKSFDAITTKYTALAKQAWMDGNGDMNAVKEAQKSIFAEQDEQMKAVLNDKQFKLYFEEVNIERKGREKHNMELIKAELKLDSIQAVQYDLANEAFFKTLIDNHDNYHGKPDVFKAYHKEIDVSRRAAFEKIMSAEQYNLYLVLAKKYKIGESEH